MLDASYLHLVTQIKQSKDTTIAFNDVLQYDCTPHGPTDSLLPLRYFSTHLSYSRLNPQTKTISSIRQRIVASTGLKKTSVTSSKRENNQDSDFRIEPCMNGTCTRYTEAATNIAGYLYSRKSIPNVTKYSGLSQFFIRKTKFNIRKDMTD